MLRAMAISAGCAVSLLAQSGVSPKEPTLQKQVVIQTADTAGFGPIGITAAMAGPMATIAGAPYSADAVTQRVQVLADGNRIELTTTGSVARDSQGRIRRDEALPGLTSNNGDAPHLVMIEDPVAGVHWTLDAQTKTAIKMPFAQAKTQGKAGAAGAFVPPPLGPDKVWFVSSSGTPPAGPPLPPPGAIATFINKDLSASDSNSSKTDLGTQTIEGVAAQGTRITRTIPAGAVGNAQPLVITTETWYSPDLKVLVMTKTSDPRMGETTYKLTNIQRSEPPASLFQVPDDYTIKDHPENTFFYREMKKNE
ncbi:MAG: hypothetical protein JOY54_10250 [Acidobacteriaceae bacterium]|nr:hypothetical protein [Acidobacteriaceae bacterium]